MEHSFLEDKAMKVWLLRLVRFWLIICLPLAAYFAYEAKQSHDLSEFFFESAKTWQVRVEDELKGKPSLLFDPQKELDERLKHAVAARDNREKYIAYATASAMSPLALLVAISAGRWIWSGGTQSNMTGVGIGFLGLTRRHLSTIGGVALAAGSTALAFAYSPSMAVATLVAVGAQAVIVIGIVWLYRKFKG